MLDTYELMIVAAFSGIDKTNRVKFFEKTFLLANTSLKIVFEILFLTLSGPNVGFLGQKLHWRTYTIQKVFPTIQCIELVEKKEFAAVVLDPKYETFVIYIASFTSFAGVYLSRKTQITGLIAKKAPT